MEILSYYNPEKLNKEIMLKLDKASANEVLKLPQDVKQWEVIWEDEWVPAEGLGLYDATADEVRRRDR